MVEVVIGVWIPGCSEKDPGVQLYRELSIANVPSSGDVIYLNVTDFVMSFIGVTVVRIGYFQSGRVVVGVDVRALLAVIEHYDKEVGKLAANGNNGHQSVSPGERLLALLMGNGFTKGDPIALEAAATQAAPT